MIRYVAACIMLCAGASAFAVGHPSGVWEEHRLFKLELEYVVLCRSFPFPAQLARAIIEDDGVRDAVKDVNDGLATSSQLLASGCFLAIKEDVRAREIVSKHIYEETLVWYCRALVEGVGGYFVLIIPSALGEE